MPRNTQPISITLPHDMAAMVRAKVASGEYATESRIAGFFEALRAEGIEPSDDPVLHFRTFAYSASVKLRSGVARGAEAPPA